MIFLELQPILLSFGEVEKHTGGAVQGKIGKDARDGRGDLWSGQESPPLRSQMGL